MMYICAWQAPELAPDRLISSRITDASVTPSPPPPYSVGNQRGKPARVSERAHEGLGIRVRLLDLNPVRAAEATTEIPDRFAVFRESARRCGIDLACRLGHADAPSTGTMSRTASAMSPQVGIPRTASSSRCATAAPNRDSTSPSILVSSTDVGTEFSGCPRG